MNDDFEDIQRLIRLKRHESPGEGFTEEFLKRFHQRQHEKELRQSALDRLLERTAAWFEDLMSPPRWALTGGAALVLAAGAWFYMSPAPENGGMAAKEAADPATKPPATNDTNRPSYDPKAMRANGQHGPDAQNAAPALHDGSQGSLER
ncbi:MAG: hypothetical protein HS117_13970 [Verrucomicrobiaceae bacterium]|nr:hypothetical protein [Verrucomicrobiaceae bacterium]